MESIYKEAGITVAELKRLIKDWPEVDIDGQPCEVWVMTGWCLSSPAVSVGTLNYREQDGKKWSDIIITPAYIEDDK